MNMHRRDIFVAADNVFSPLGTTTAENFANLKQGITAVRPHHDPNISPQPFFASLFGKDEPLIEKPGDYTRFEQLLIASVKDALLQCDVKPEDPKTILIVSSTKGNISLLETEEFSPTLQERISLNTSARLVAKHFGFINKPVVISNACVSGVMAIVTGMRLLRTGHYEHAVIAGADVISAFILSGFQSFQALSPGVCKPFDKTRDGLNLGEGAGTMILSASACYKDHPRVKGGGISNDANHISGPSRTGKELSYAINQSLKDAELDAGDLDFISAHGTATPYNDEMEANAISLSGLGSVPLNSLKAHYGHTLGAAGMIESIISVRSMEESTILPTIGFNEKGVTKPVSICTSLRQTKVRNVLKTASGFGGCNAAVVFGK
ncbi:MAG TPA: beta-ketoacyl synthase N-terminal-like domain-containing protein [Mucilaginibacter sp.]|nr:beta-ketoacyl synthase N-terminal-like domain-containing protein [Mucilaginibacter sp.]